MKKKKTSGEDAKFGKIFVSFPGKAEKIAGKENGVSSWGSFFFFSLFKNPERKMEVARIA